MMIDPFHYATRAATIRKQSREETAALLAASLEAIRRSGELLDRVAADRSFGESLPHSAEGTRSTDFP